MTTRAHSSINRTARLAGALYLALAPFGFFGIIYVPSVLIVPGDAATTCRNIMASEWLFRSGTVSHLIGQVIFIFLVLAMYRLLKPVNKDRALLMVVLALLGVPIAFLNEVNHLAALRLLSSADYGAFTSNQLHAQTMLFLDMRESGILISLVFWGLWLLPLGFLVFRSGFLPKVLGVLVVIAGAGYVIDSSTQLLFPGLTAISQITLFGFIGELLLPLWLLIKGVNVERWQQVTLGNQALGTYVVSTNVAKPARVAIIGASGNYGRGILARAEQIGVEAVVVTRSPHKFKDVKPTTTVVEAQLDDQEKLKQAFTGCDGVISALGDDRKERPKTHYLPHVWNAMKAAGVTKYVGMGSGPMMMPGERPGGFQRTVHALLSVLKLFGVDMLEQNEWERDSLLMSKNGADGVTWVLTRPVRPTRTPFVGACVHKDRRGPLNCSIYDHGDFCLYCAVSSEWDKLAPHVSSGPQPKKK